MTLKALSDFVIHQKYSKYLPTENRREDWPEIVDRSLGMHLKKFDNLDECDKNEIRWAFSLVREKKVLPSMRGMQFAGEGVEKANARLYNCGFGHIQSSRAVEKAFYLLLCGTGMGFHFGQKWVKQFPKVTKEKDGVLIHDIEDSIEGWATSAKVLLDSFLEGNEYTGKQIKFLYHNIRPKGASISHGGVAPGPDGLKFAHQKIHRLLSACGDTLRSIDICDIKMHLSDAVLSGGIRRAACINLFDKEDGEMLMAKVGKWFVDNPQRARGNNTVLLKRDELTFEEFESIIEFTKQWGEPGFAFVSDIDTGLNPCGEVSFLPFYEGKPAFQFCNLSVVNGNKIKDSGDMMDAIWAASLIGTLQATYTDFNFLDDEDRKITEAEALLGVSIMGYLANPEFLLNEEALSRAAKWATFINEKWAQKLGINPAARVTCTKPDGNSSCVLESPFSGIHPAHSQQYFRRVQVNKNDPVYQHFKKTNPHLCTESIYSATGTDDVITFPIEVENPAALFKEDLTALEHLEIIKKVNRAWIKNGEANNKRPVSHSISCTVLVGEDEWDDVAKYLYENREHFTTVSLLPRTGDKDYAQAPYEAVTTEEEKRLFENLTNLTNVVKYSEMIEESDNTKFTEEVACVGGTCAL